MGICQGVLPSGVFPYKCPLASCRRIEKYGKLSGVLSGWSCFLFFPVKSPEWSIIRLSFFVGMVNISENRWGEVGDPIRSLLCAGGAPSLNEVHGLAQYENAFALYCDRSYSAPGACLSCGFSVVCPAVNVLIFLLKVSHFSPYFVFFSDRFQFADFSPGSHAFYFSYSNLFAISCRPPFLCCRLDRFARIVAYNVTVQLRESSSPPFQRWCHTVDAIKTISLTWVCNPPNQSRFDIILI